MTKSAVRAMDAITAFAATGGQPVSRFVVSGASKRGWTTWTTAAVDTRVIAIAPAVIDMLNVEPSFVHHWRVYGAWSEAVKDYVEHGIMDWMGTPQFRALMRIEEPYEYRDRLTLPKFLLNASGDQFFLPDSSRFYFDDLRGETNLRYVPNASHSLDKTDALESVQAFYASIVAGTPRPAITWTFERDGSIKVVARQRPDNVLLWQATNPAARNFRQDAIGNAYTSTSLTPSGPNTWVARVRRPPKGFTAFFVEMTFPSGGKYPFKITSGVRVVPDTLPFPAPVRKNPAAAPANPALTLEARTSRRRTSMSSCTAARPAASITAIAAAREGASRGAARARDHLGGMVSGGLGWTDYGKKEVIGGYSLEFFERVGRRSTACRSSGTSSRTSPRRSSASWVAEAGVRVFFRPSAASRRPA